MSIEMVKAIAVLCQIFSGSGNFVNIDRQQGECHAYFSQCLKDHNDSISLCMRLRREAMK